MVTLTGTELLQVVPLRWDGTPSPVSEQTTTQEIANLGVGAQGWTAGKVTAIGGNLTLNAGTLSASSNAGTVTSITVGAGLAGSTITGAGTISLSTTGAGMLVGNPGTSAAVASGIAVGSGLTLSSGGTLSAAAMTVEANGAVQAGVTALNFGSGTTVSVAAGVATVTAAPARNAGRLQAQWVSGATVANDTVYLAFSAPYAGTVDSLDYFTGTGSFSAAININGAAVTGLSSVTVTSPTPANAAASGANTFAAGAKITAVITGATSSPTDALLNLNVTWS